MTDTNDVTAQSGNVKPHRVRHALGKLGADTIKAFEPLGAMEMGVPLPVDQRWAGADDDADYDKTTHVERHTDEHVRGSRTYVDQHTEKDESLEGSFDNRTKALIDGEIEDKITAAMAAREARENFRANKRNFNRMLTLFGALLIGIAVSWVLSSGLLGELGKMLSPFSFTITIAMDMGLALYGYIKKY